MGRWMVVVSMIAVWGCVSAPPPATERGAAGAPTRGAEAAPEEVSDRAFDAGAAQDEAPEEYVNTLRWTTASEVDNFGFDIYRSTSPDGPFERITDMPIAGAGTVDEPQDYVYEDADIDPTRAYYYYIESISMASVRERFSPVIRAEPKRPLEGAGEESSGSEQDPS